MGSKEHRHGKAWAQLQIVSLLTQHARKQETGFRVTNILFPLRGSVGLTAYDQRWLFASLRNK